MPVLRSLLCDPSNLSAVEAAHVARRHIDDICVEIRHLLGLNGVENLAATLHPNGFTKIQLFRGPRLTIRLHLWDRVGHDLETRIHGHAWSLSSVVLSGQIVHTIYNERTRGER